jgi:hypothetical protein
LYLSNFGLNLNKIDWTQTSLKLKSPHVISQQQYELENCTSNNKLAPSWCMDAEGTARFIGDTKADGNGTIHKMYYNRNGFEQCLANKSVFFIGDSRVRYQFMALAAFLKSGKWMKCQDYIGLGISENQTDPSCLLIDETMNTGGWNKWYQETTQSLNSNTTQEMICDCSRKTPFKTATTYENRFLQRKTPFGLIKVTYLQNFVNEISMHAEFPPHSPFGHMDQQGRCSPGLCDHLPKSEGTINTTLWEQLYQLQPTHIFASLGWEQVFNSDQVSQFSCDLEMFERHNPSTKVFVISHPPRFGRKPKLPPLRCNVSVLDRTTPAYDVPKTWYWDGLHVRSILNQEYNHMMIKKICP